MLEYEIIHKLFDMMSHEEYTKDHPNNALMGKVNLMLYSTLGEPSFFKWLSSAQPKGNHYEFKGYSIYRRAQAIKDVVQIDDYAEFKKSIREYAGKDIDNPDILTILNEVNTNTHRLDRAYAFLDASVLITAKLARFLRRQRYIPGDIIHTDEPTEDLNMTLLDLYREQEELSNNLEAARILAKQFEISLEEPFKKVNFDHRTRWSAVSQSTVDLNIEEDENVILFQDNESITGRVFLKENKIDSVETYWSKSVDQRPYRAISVPWQDKFPLYNLNRLRSTPRDCPVIVCDSLTAAHQASSENNQKYAEIQKELSILTHSRRYKDNLSWLRNKLWHDNQSELQGFCKNNSISIGIEFNLAFFCATTLDTKDYNNNALYANVNCANYCKLTQQNVISCLDKTYEQRLAETRTTLYSCNPPNSFDRERFYVFNYCLSLIEKGIEQQKQSDVENIKVFKSELENFDRFIITSWYGQCATIGRVDLRPLHNKSQIYYLFDPNKKESVTTALWFCEYLKHQLSGGKTFPQIFLVSSCQKEPFKLEELKELAEQLEIKMPKLTDSKEFADSITFDDESLKCEEEKFIFEPLFRRRSISMIYSEPNVGKTFFAQSLALAMIHGANLFDMRSSIWRAVKNKPLRVLYIDSEMSKGSFFKRLRMLKDFYVQQYKGTDVPLLKYKLVAKSDWNLAGENPEHRDIVSKMLNLDTKDQIDFVIFDNLSTLTGGSDSQKNWMTFFAWLRKLSNAGVASCCLHHSGKNGDQRGTSLRSATLDNVIRLRRALEDDNSISLTVTVEKARDVSKADLHPLHIKLVKSKCKDDNENPKECWRWVTMLANGKESLDIKERNQKILDLYNLKLLSNKAIADLFGIEESTLKALIAKHKKGTATCNK